MPTRNPKRYSKQHNSRKFSFFLKATQTSILKWNPKEPMMVLKFGNFKTSSRLLNKIISLKLIALQNNFQVPQPIYLLYYTSIEVIHICKIFLINFGAKHFVFPQPSSYSALRVDWPADILRILSFRIPYWSWDPLGKPSPWACWPLVWWHYKYDRGFM